MLYFWHGGLFHVLKTIPFSRKQEKLRVAVNFRISTNNPEQFGSLETQTSYFKTIIQENPNWKFVKIYSDVGSALRTKNRPSYRQMILDGEKGLFDLILVKSLGRFRRDTVEALTQIRKWKQMNIGLYSETEDIDTIKGSNGVLVVVPEEAEIVRKNFDLYLQGNAVRKIKRYLEEHGIKTATGKDVWSTSTIDRMLSNKNTLVRY